MFRCILPVFVLSLVAMGLRLAGCWKAGAGVGEGLFALTLILLLLSIVGGRDPVRG